MKQTSAGIRELREHLGAYLRKVESGETVTITDRGKPVGRLVPARREEPLGEEPPEKEEDKRTLEEKMRALQKAGVAEWSGKKFGPREPVAENKSNRMASDLLLEDRR